MSNYLYFLANVKDIKDHILAYVISCKIFFQLMVTEFQKKHKLIVILFILSSFMFVIGTVFVSEQITYTGFKSC